MELAQYMGPFEKYETPFYFYDMDLLDSALRACSRCLLQYGYIGHYAMKANANPRILEMVIRAGFGADCVSGNEVQLAHDVGFDPNLIVFSGVGKTDKEIRIALKCGIFCINVESLPEIEVINELAAQMGKTAPISLRLNPNIDAHTHRKITTGLSLNKFGIGDGSLPQLPALLAACSHVKLRGIHFHIGSQITDLQVFETLCHRVNEMQRWFEDHDLPIEHISMGGGLGIDYTQPLEHPIAAFQDYFATFHKYLEVRKGQKVHFEPGRSLVGPCGFLIARVLFVKEGRGRRFVVLDAGMNDLIRPALYGAHHAILNLSAVRRQTEGAQPQAVYDVVGPICESSDVFARRVRLPITQRGDVVAICAAGAYGQVMAMRYNQRDLAKDFYSTDF